MKLILPFDTETNGMPDWKVPSDTPHQPHIVQLAAIVAEEATGNIREYMDVLIKPNGWTIDAALTEIHGITMERAMDEGIPEDLALDQFLSLYDQCDLRVAHNTTFDNRILRIALKRFRPDRISDEEWKDKDRYYCTYTSGRKIMGGNKGHTLKEMYKHFMGREMEGEHSALCDATACLEIYLAQIKGVQ